MKERDIADRARYDTAATAAATPSAAEQQREAERKAYFDWKAKGDFRTPPPSLIGVSFGPEAERRRQMERTATPTGSAGMGAGYASPTALAMTREYLGNVNAENDALAYQGALGGEDLYQRTNNSAALMNSDFMRKMGLLNSAQNQSQFQSGARIQTTPQSIWPALISGGLSALGQAGAAMATGGASTVAMGAANAHPSDSRLKNDIRPLSQILKLRGMAWRWDEKALRFGMIPGTTGVGVLADDVAEAFPDLVTILDDGYRGVNYQALVGILTETVRDLCEENARLKLSPTGDI